VRPLFKAPREEWVPGSARTWIAVNAAKQSSLNKNTETKIMTTLHLRKSIDRSSLRRGLLLVPLMLGCLALSPKAQATDLGSVVAGDNTADGSGVLVNLTTGTDNSGFGFQALNQNTSGTNNTANGFQALHNNTSGGGNTANGLKALYHNTTINGQSGHDNTATGNRALFSNTTGINNTANGYHALYSNIDGSFNTATGFEAFFSNIDGIGNTAGGVQALFSNTTGSNNTANGVSALYHNTTGNFNIALGFQAGIDLTKGDNNIDIGNLGIPDEANTIRIGTVGTQTTTFIAGISGVAVNGSPVVVNSNGKLGVSTSSARFKEAVKPMDKASEAILSLQPVTFHYKKDLDPDGIPQFGLVAEEVEKVNPALVARDAAGKVYTVRYEAVNAMLLNEFLKEHRTVQELKKEIAALTATVQKVSAQVEMSRPAPQTVVDNH